MSELIYRIRLKIQKDGFRVTFQKACRWIRAHYLIKIDLVSILDVRFHRANYEAMIEEALGGSCERVFLWRSSFGWNVPLFQRPQHVARALSKQGTLVFYEITTLTDRVRALKKAQENLYLINFNNRAIRALLLQKLAECKKPKYLQFYAPDCTIGIEELKSYIASGYKILYEYIDELSPALVGTKTLPKNISDKYEYMLSDTQNVFVVVTADVLWQDVAQKRGEEKLVFSCNGVDKAHFENPKGELSADFASLCQSGKPIIGYYGALATWFDYDLLKYCAAARPDYEFALFGIKYDGSFDEAGLEAHPNIHFYGAKPYDVLPAYAARFTVCTIPFLINDITKATNPVKLFEYMALQKPIVTTAMNECKKYGSVLAAETPEDYLKDLDRAVKMTPETDPDYFALLQKEAAENDWTQKAAAILELLRRYE